MSEDMEQLRKKHWEKFVDEYIKEAKTVKYPEIISKEGYNNYKIYRLNSGDKITPNMPELNFILELVRLQKEKKGLIPYVWVWALSGYTLNISEYCKKHLYKTLLANGFEKYPGAEKSIKLLESDFDDALRAKLYDGTLNGKRFAKILQDFVDDYMIISED